MDNKQNPNIEYKTLTTADYDNYFALRLEGLQNSPHMYATDANDWQNARREVIEKHLTNSESNEFPILGAWDGDVLVGMVGLQPDIRPTVKHKATLWGVFVKEPYRRQGIGFLLIATAIDMAKEKEGLKQLRAVVNTTNDTAVRLFERAGFEQFGLERRAKFFDGAFHDQAYFWYVIDDGE